jgi:hypothetical protein
MNQSPIDSEDYLMVTLTATSDGIINRYVHTIFVGFSGKPPKFEIREPSIINPEIMKKTLNSIGEFPLIVNSLRDLILFRIFGGHGIIRKKLVDEYWPEINQASTCVYGGHEPGFVDTDSIPNSEFVKRPRKKTKLRVKQRDENKCMFCNSDKNLTLHHILHRERGGRTVDNNLITSCAECQKKLHENPKQVFDDSLYKRIGVNKHYHKKNEQFWQDVEHYSILMLKAISRIAKIDN